MLKILLTLCCLSLGTLSGWANTGSWKQQAQVQGQLEEHGGQFELLANALEHKEKNDFYESYHFKLKQIQLEITKLRPLTQSAQPHHEYREDLQSLELQAQLLGKRLSQAYNAQATQWAEQKLSIEASMNNLLFDFNQVKETILERRLPRYKGTEVDG